MKSRGRLGDINHGDSIEVRLIRGWDDGKLTQVHLLQAVHHNGVQITVARSHIGRGNQSAPG